MLAETAQPITSPAQIAQGLTMADRIIMQADAGQFPPPAKVMGKLQSGDFELDGLQFKFKQQTHNGITRLYCSSLIGYMPYTAEKRERRAALQKILSASLQLRHARFRIDRQNYIHLQCGLPLPQDHADEDIILALLSFYQEAKPILGLIAAQLQS